ncbi:unnamed protein product [Discosporangium mesarthrocarpum]
MERTKSLCQQLSRLLNMRFGAEEGWAECRVDGTLRPPSPRQSTVLKQVLLAGLPDCVAKRAPPGTITDGSRWRGSYAYLSCNQAVKEPLYIKSASGLFSRDPEDLPQWVVYQDMVRGEREGSPANMVCVTAIDPMWLPRLTEGSPLLQLSDPLASPPPFYCPYKGMVMCYVTPRYGIHAWPLPPYLVGMAHAVSPPPPPSSSSTSLNVFAGRKGVTTSCVPDLVYRWFARLLLEGKVHGTLAELSDGLVLNDPPALVTLERPVTKVAALLTTLRREGVCSLPGLQEKWRRDPSFLKGAVQLWVRVEGRPTFEVAWQAAIKTARSAAGEECAGVEVPSSLTGKGETKVGEKSPDMVGRKKPKGEKKGQRKRKRILARTRQPHVLLACPADGVGRMG